MIPSLVKRGGGRRFVEAAFDCPGVSFPAVFSGSRLAAYMVTCREQSWLHILHQMSRQEDLPELSEPPAHLHGYGAGSRRSLRSKQCAYGYVPLFAADGLHEYKLRFGYEMVPHWSAIQLHPVLKAVLDRPFARAAVRAVRRWRRNDQHLETIETVLEGARSSGRGINLMPTSRLHSIPRFALPYTPGDFAAGLRAIFQRRSASRGVRTARRQPEVLDPQRPAGAPAAAGRARSEARIGRGPALVYGSFAGQGHRGRRPPAGLHRRGPPVPDDGSGSLWRTRAERFPPSSRSTCSVSLRICRPYWRPPEVCPSSKTPPTLRLVTWMGGWPADLEWPAFTALPPPSTGRRAAEGSAIVHRARMARKLADFDSIAFSAFARSGIAQPGSSGGKGRRLQPAAVWVFRKANAPVDR